MMLCAKAKNACVWPQMQLIWEFGNGTWATMRSGPPMRDALFWDGRLREKSRSTILSHGYTRRIVIGSERLSTRQFMRERISILSIGSFYRMGLWVGWGRVGVCTLMKKADPSGFWVSASIFFLENRQKS